MEIQTTPIGAEVYLDGQYLGKTPLQASFIHYGTRHVELRRKGYQNLSAWLKLAPPIYEVFPLDFFSEVLLPYPLEDRHRFHFNLKKRPAVFHQNLERFRKKSKPLMESSFEKKESK